MTGGRRNELWSQDARYPIQVLVDGVFCQLTCVFIAKYFTNLVTSSIMFNPESNTNFLEANKQLCNRIERKLTELNKMGQNLKKENTGKRQAVKRPF